MAVNLIKITDSRLEPGSATGLDHVDLSLISQGSQVTLRQLHVSLGHQMTNR